MPTFSLPASPPNFTIQLHSRQERSPTDPRASLSLSSRQIQSSKCKNQNFSSPSGFSLIFSLTIKGFLLKSTLILIFDLALNNSEAQESRIFGTMLEPRYIFRAKSQLTSKLLRTF